MYFIIILLIAGITGAFEVTEEMYVTSVDKEE